MLSERLKKVLKKNNKKNQTLGLFVEMKMETSDHSDMHSNHSLVSHIIASNVEPTKKTIHSIIFGNIRGKIFRINAKNRDKFILTN